VETEVYMGEDKGKFFCDIQNEVMKIRRSIQLF